MKNQKTLIIACLAAATAGVAIGMLIAPDKGENLRKNVKKTVGDFANRLSDMLQESGRKATDTPEQASTHKEQSPNVGGLN
jgi:gas vesicle protein